MNSLIQKINGIQSVEIILIYLSMDKVSINISVENFNF